jgi:hypothetical protein
MKRKSFLFLSLSFAVFLLAGAFHHHPDGLKHETCSICHSVSCHSEYSGPEGLSVNPLILSSISPLPDDPLFRPLFISFFRLSRAPPLSSPLS